MRGVSDSRIEKLVEPPTNAQITFSENGYGIYMMIAVNCLDPDCDDAGHVQVIDNFKDAAISMGDLADRFLALAEIEGEG